MVVRIEYKEWFIFSDLFVAVQNRRSSSAILLHIAMLANTAQHIKLYANLGNKFVNVLQLFQVKGFRI